MKFLFSEFFNFGRKLKKSLISRIKRKLQFQGPRENYNFERKTGKINNYTYNYLNIIYTI